MTGVPGRTSLVRSHPFLAAYAAVLLVAWLVTVATWSTRPGELPVLHPVAQALQYVVVAIAATLAALRILVQPPELREGGSFRFYDLQWQVRDDTGGQAFWTALWVGAAAMAVNVALLAVADVFVGDGAGGILTYLEWLGTGIAAGGAIGMFAALPAAGIASIVRRLGR
jgi:hypothetical protein